MTASHTQKHHNKTLGFTAWVVHLLLLALMLTLAIWAARWGWAEVLIAEPRNVMDNWKTGQAMPSNEELDRLGNLLERAQSLNSQSADIAFDRGRFAEWRAQKYPLWAKEAHKHREEAIGYFKNALNARPSWGMTWVHLANSLILNQQLYSGGMEALEKATVLAPLEIPVQQRVIWLAFSQWKIMDNESRGRVRGIVENALVYRQHNLIIKAVADFGLESEFSALLIDEHHQNQLQRALIVRNKRKRR